MLFLWLLAGLVIQINADAGDELKIIQDDFWAMKMRERPEAATYYGIHDYNDQVESFDTTSFTRRRDACQVFIDRLADLELSELSTAERVNFDILTNLVSVYVDNYKWRMYGSLNPINFLEGANIDPESEVTYVPLKSKTDFENYISRLHLWGAQLDEKIALFQEAVSLSRTYHAVSIARVPDQLKTILVNASESPFYLKAFVDILENSTIPESDWAQLKTDGLIGVQANLDGYQRLHDYIKTDYLSNTRAAIGIDDWDSTGKYYQAAVAFHLSTDMTVDAVHELGLNEVARITQNMQTIMTRQDFTGTVKEYFDMLKNDSSFYLESGDAIVEEYTRMIEDRIKPKLKEFFGDFPDLPLKVEAMPFDGPGGYYYSGSEDGTRPGIFQVNVMRPHSSPTFDMMALLLHEGYPGHHLQFCFSAKSSLPLFRKYSEGSKYYAVPFNFPYYSSYSEGWALYTEFLGEEMGLYKDDYELMGKYSGEILRACRLVVDTGMHAKKWTRDRALQYMLDHTSYSQEDMEIEIDRYITWPGQACAYKIGELKIKELRKLAEDTLKSDFSLPDFHALMLTNGAVPLNILDQFVDEWIKQRKTSAASVTKPVSFVCVVIIIINAMM